jgi:hypothetical protein
MGVVNEAVEDGVGVSGVADHVMPCGQGKLRGDDRGPAAVSLLEDFEEVMTGARAGLARRVLSRSASPRLVHLPAEISSRRPTAGVAWRPG